MSFFAKGIWSLRYLLPWYFGCWFRLWKLTLPNGTWRQMHFNTFIHTLVCWIMRSTTTILPLEVNLHQGSPIVDGKSFVPKIGNHFSRVSSLCLCICIWYIMCIYIYMWMYMYTNQINHLTCLINWFFPFLPSTNITPTANTPCRGFTKTHTVTVLKLSPSLGTKGGAMEESPSTVVSVRRDTRSTCFERTRYECCNLIPWKLTWLAGKSPFSIGNSWTHSWWMFQPVMLVFFGGYSPWIHPKSCKEMIWQEILFLGRNISVFSSQKENTASNRSI